jgi:hypothetical protein
MMQSCSWNGKSLITLGILGVTLVQFMICLSCAGAFEQPERSMRSTGGSRDLVTERFGPILLAELVQTQDSVIMRTDPKDRTYEERQWEEREKEQQSWDMLKNMIIDGRPLPRRFSDPRPNERPQ